MTTSDYLLNRYGPTMTKEQAMRESLASEKEIARYFDGQIEPFRTVSVAAFVGYLNETGAL